MLIVVISALVLLDLSSAFDTVITRCNLMFPEKNALASVERPSNGTASTSAVKRRPSKWDHRTPERLSSTAVCTKLRSWSTEVRGLHRGSTSGDRTILYRTSSLRLSSFPPASISEIAKLLHASPNKQYDLDLILTLLKQVCQAILIITTISFPIYRYFPNVYKQSLVTPLLKKPSIDKDTLKNSVIYRICLKFPTSLNA